MNCEAYCKHCRHDDAWHDDEGKCRVGCASKDMRGPCPCPGYELEPGSDWSPKDELHVRVETPALKRGR